jgi:hypothetical protein
MAYFLGRDVKVAISTESATGVDINSNAARGTATPTSGDCIEALSASAGDVFGTGSSYNQFTDVTSVDLTLGKIDEDIAYMGQRTALKAEIKNETTVVITLKKSNKFWDHVFMDARYGTDGSDLIDGLSQPTAKFGYRIYLALKDDGSSEVISIPNMVFADHSVALNVDGTTEETLTFTGHVEPYINTEVVQTATTTNL